MAALQSFDTREAPQSRAGPRAGGPRSVTGPESSPQANERAQEAAAALPPVQHGLLEGQHVEPREEH